MNGVELIAEERLRQMEVEGRSLEHDAYVHRGGELAGAAVCYAIHDLRPGATLVRKEFEAMRNVVWPWAEHYWKPKDPIRNLVRAGALIAAEIDRRMRASGAQPAPVDQSLLTSAPTSDGSV